MGDQQHQIEGRVEPGFEPVKEAFEKNFEDRDELGAACAVSYQGELVVDIWGGYKDVERTDPWTEDTLVLVFSTTKGIAAATIAHARAAGHISYDARVAELWPAFGTNGKEDITVRQLLGHQAGLAAVNQTLTADRLEDREWLMETLARKRPDWTPGARHGYHAWTLGWYESELLRRCDPQSRALPEYFSAELADPLDLEFYIGIPDEIDEGRIAAIQGFGARDLVGNLTGFPWKMLLALANPRSMVSKSMSPFDVSSPAELNDPPYRYLQIPAGNGIGAVRDIARLYGALATEAGPPGFDTSTIDALAQPGNPPAEGPQDVILKTETAYSLGFWKPFEGFDFGTPAAFGAPGAGGSFAFADPARELGFAYAPNRMGVRVWDDPREVALRDAVSLCLDEL
ncbi:serine hydrolase domain-containing protein [Haloarchaeobius amylolyticus]|uniref:serine hydrolase domain-containing protein n=1 Tax=Haloarchaeobius amylolyticus TaxID=1198296 RepID=UPI00226F6E66|nr:serine hydrolase domain-containing protein [Haloarchaeobius amylolyticus]